MRRGIWSSVVAAAAFGTTAYAQQPDAARLLGKVCTGTWDSHAKGYPQPLDRGALRFTFGSALPLGGTSESAFGEAAFKAPDRVTAFATSGALKDVAFNGNKLTFVSGAGNKYDLTGDGVTFTGKLDPRPTYAVVSDVVLRCR